MRETVWGGRDNVGWVGRQCGVGETWGERDSVG